MTGIIIVITLGTVIHWMKSDYQEFQTTVKRFKHTNLLDSKIIK